MRTSEALYALLIECCQDHYDADSMAQCLDGFNDWERFFDRAYVHGVLPLVYKRLNDAKLGIPADILLELKNRNMHIAQTNMLMSNELVKILKSLKNNSIDAMAFKGPVLSQLLYNNVLLRQYSDIDVLVDASRVYDAAKLLVDDGFEPKIPLKFLKNKTLLRVDKDITLTHRRLNIHVELHWELFDKKMLVEHRDLLSDCQEIKINQFECFTLSHENLLIYLCVHGSKHFWERLEWIVDIDRLIRCAHDIDWKYIQKQADMMEVNRLMYLGLAVSFAIFQTPLPQYVHDAIKKDAALMPMRQKLITSILNNGIDVEKKQPVDVESIAHMAELMDSTNARIKSRLVSYMQIKSGDVLMADLPASLSWLYYLLRVIRLLKKYLMHFFKKSVT